MKSGPELHLTVESEKDLRFPHIPAAEAPGQVKRLGDKIPATTAKPQKPMAASLQHSHKA